MLVRPSTVILSTLAVALLGFLAGAATLVSSEPAAGLRDDARADLRRAGGGGAAVGLRDRVQVEPVREPPGPPPTRSALTIRVVRPDGTPCPGAVVRLVGFDAPDGLTADERGEVRLDGRIGALYGVLATAEGWAGTPGAAWRQPRTGHAVTVTVEPTRSVHGVVLEQDGETRAEGALVRSVCVVADEPRMAVHLQAQAASDRRGLFTVAGVPRAALELTAEPNGARQGRTTTVRVGPEPAAGLGGGSADDPVTVRFGLLTRHEIVVRDADGGGALEAGTVIVYRVDGDGARTVLGISPAAPRDEAEPVAVVAVPPAETRSVLVHAAGYAESEILELSGDGEDAATVQRHEVRLRRGSEDEAVVLLRVSARPGPTPQRLRLSWVHGDAWLTRAQSVEDGTVTLRLPPGTSRLEIGGAAHRDGADPGFLPLTVALDLRAGETVSREVVLHAGGTVRIRPRDPGDRTRLPAPRTALDEGGAEHPVASRYGSDERSDLLAIGPLPEGTWRIVFEDETVPPVVAVVRAGETTDVLVR